MEAERSCGHSYLLKVDPHLPPGEVTENTCEAAKHGNILAHTRNRVLAKCCLYISTHTHTGCTRCVCEQLFPFPPVNKLIPLQETYPQVLVFIYERPSFLHRGPPTYTNEPRVTKKNPTRDNKLSFIPEGSGIILEGFNKAKASGPSGL